MSNNYARSRSLHVDRAKGHRICVILPDGSVVTTCGIVRNVEWQFETRPGELYYRDVYVLEDLAQDFILDYKFLYETDAFDQYEDCFYDIDVDDIEGDITFCTIKKIVQGSEEQDLSHAAVDAVLELLKIKDTHMNRMQGLPTNEKERATAEFYKWWEPRYTEASLSYQLSFRNQTPQSPQIQRPTRTQHPPHNLRPPQLPPPPPTPPQPPQQYRLPEKRTTLFSRIWKRKGHSVNS